MMNFHSEQNPWLATRTRTGAEYDASYAVRAASGEEIHGEANLVQKLLQAHYPDHNPRDLSILDAGCGTGRTAIELDGRGYNVVGVDLDDVMLSQARAKAPDMQWVLGDLSTLELDQRFDAIVMAGNVMIYLTPNTELAALTKMSHFLKPTGLLLSAFELNPQPWTDLTIDAYDQMTASLGLTKLARWSTWEQDPWHTADTYAVSLHQKP